MKIESLTSDEKEYYFNSVFASGIYTIPEFCHKYGMPDLSYKADDVNAYVAKHYPDKYKKIVQDGYKMTEGDKLGATPKGYKNVRKADIIAAVAKKTGTTKKAATEIVNAYWDVIKQTLKSNSTANISIPNVGSIRCVRQKARTYNVSSLKHTSKKTAKSKAKTKAKFFVSDNFLTKSATVAAVAATPKKRKKKATTTTTTAKKKKKTTSTSKTTKAKAKAKSTTSTTKKKTTTKAKKITKRKTKK
jgi:nucleoid DNA-binding protein